MLDPSVIKKYHAHLYYDENRLFEAEKLRETIGKVFQLSLGKLHQKPVGPHPVWSSQVTVPVERFQDFVSWLALNRGSVDVFIHPITGDDFSDHSQFVIWLGRSYELDLSIFEASSNS